jgi:trans-2,3-dihydro-3-hydroxyanthranilate isomerase
VRSYSFRIVNVFTLDGQRLSGNPLCVFEDGRGLSDATMQALACQTNLSETTFVLPREDGRIGVRIFTPSYEMPFAGHPTLGTAHVVAKGRTTISLELRAGTVEVLAEGAHYTLRTAKPPRSRAFGATRGELADALGLAESALLDDPTWIDTGVEQLVVPVGTVADVRAAKPSPQLLVRHATSLGGEESMAYVIAEEAPGRHVARFFFTSHGALIEDPATGSACANFGGFHLVKGRELPLRTSIRQGDEVARPSRLDLEVDTEGRVFVKGEVIELGRGTIEI